MKILVTGPHRSGTTFVSHVLSDTHGIPHVDELQFNCSYLDEFFAMVSPMESWVAQAPGLFHAVPKIIEAFPDVQIVVIRRNIDDIIASQEDIKYSFWEDREKDLIGYLKDPRPISVIKYEVWDKWKNELPNTKEYQYDEFSTHPFFVDAPNRSQFNNKQWKLA